MTRRALILDDHSLAELATFMADAVRAGVPTSQTAERLIQLVTAETRQDSASTAVLDLTAGEPDAAREEPPLLLDRAEAARLLGIGTTTLGTLDGLDPVRVGRRVLYRRSDLERFVRWPTEKY